MTFNPDIHHRRSIRLRDYDYDSCGAYFVTMCTHERECLFGGIAGDVMELSAAGRKVAEVWNGLSGRFPHVMTDEFVVMPNHVHGIIFIVGAPLAAPCFFSEFQSKHQGAASSAPTPTPNAPTLGQIMRVFKSLSAISVNRILDRTERPLWQRNFYERIVRDEDELAGVREYIRFNPLKWPDDTENPVNV
jgi:REP element-mobilizing transposase RayT